MTFQLPLVNHSISAYYKFSATWRDSPLLGVRHVIQPLVPIGLHCYMDEVKKIQGAAPLQRADQPAYLQTISSPLRDHLSAWQLAL